MTTATTRIPYTAAWLAYAQRVVSDYGHLVYSANLPHFSPDGWNRIKHEKWPADYWNDASGLSAPLRPVEPRTREDDGKVLCPDCSRDTPSVIRRMYEYECPTCDGPGVCGVVAAIAWELERVPHPHIPGFARRLVYVEAFLDAVLWVPVAYHEADAATMLRHGLPPAELARRLATVWQHVRNGSACMAAVAVERGTVLDLDGERNDRQTHWMRGGSHWRDVPRYNGAERVAAIMRNTDVVDELSRRQQADRMVLSSGRVVERAWLLGGE